MSLFTATVSRGDSNELLSRANYGNLKRDFLPAIRTILSKIPPNDSRLTYVWESNLIHYVKADGVVYLVLTDDKATKRLAYGFLAEVQVLTRPVALRRVSDLFLLLESVRCAVRCELCGLGARGWVQVVRGPA